MQMFTQHLRPQIKSSLRSHACQKVATLVKNKPGRLKCARVGLLFVHFVCMVCGCMCEEKIQKNKDELSKEKKRVTRVIRFLFLVTFKVEIL